jgi:hypothetical protein
MNDDRLRLTRQLDTCLNSQKILTHSPKQQEMTDSVVDLIPAMYTRILEISTFKIKAEIENVFSYYLERYEAS